MTDIVERLREWSLCNMYPESACTDIGVAINEITALRAENERLRAALEWFADEYDRQNFMRSADMHRAECRCLRCARDEARAALEEKP